MVRDPMANLTVGQLEPGWPVMKITNQLMVKRENR